MVRREEADPARRSDCLVGGAGRLCPPRAGLEGRGARCGNGLGALLGTGRAGSLGAGFRTLLGDDLAALAAGRDAARALSPRARDGFLEGCLEELTPKFSDPSHRARYGLQRYDDRLHRR